jgi:hypothetical protein
MKFIGAGGPSGEIEARGVLRRDQREVRRRVQKKLTPDCADQPGCLDNPGVILSAAKDPSGSILAIILLDSSLRSE